MRTRFLAVAALGLGLALSAAAQQVTLPLTDFEKLRERAKPKAEGPSAPAAPFVLESAELEVAVSPASARVVSVLTLTLDAPGWQSVPLGEMGSFVASDLGGLEGRVVAGDGRSGPTLAVRGAGRHAVRLESVVAVLRDETATRPTWRLGLKPPRAAVVRGVVKAPAEVEEAELQPGGLARREGPGLFRFVAAPGEDLTVALYGRQTLPERARLPLRFEATSATAVTLSRTKLAVDAFVEARVAQGQLAEVTVDLPAGFEVVRVAGPIAGWKVDGGRLTVGALAPVETIFSFGVEMTAPPKDAFAPPLLVPREADRISYLAFARLEGDGLLRLTDPGATRAPSETELARLPRALKQSAVRPIAVTDPARPPRFEAAWAERTEVLAAQVDRLRADIAVGEAGRATYRLWLEIRNRGAQELTVTLPSGFELVGAARDGRPVVPGASGGGLAIPLLSREAAQVVYLAGLLPLALPERGDFALPLPTLSAPAARVEIQALLPASRAYELADPTRAGPVGPPPRPVALAPTSEAIANVANQIALPRANEDASLLAPPTAPDGFVALAAAWSALSTSPAPLALRVRPAKEDREWF